MTKTYKQIVTAATPATDARISELEGYRADRFSPTWGLVDTLIARIEADAKKIGAAATFLSFLPQQSETWPSRKQMLEEAGRLVARLTDKAVTP